MKLVINKYLYNKIFVTKYLKKVILNIINSNFNPIKSKKLSQELGGLNIREIIVYAVNNLLISEVGDKWVIEINKSLNYGNYNLGYLINFITYGNINTKGYKILYIIFKYIANNIDKIYKEWLDGY